MARSDEYWDKRALKRLTDAEKQSEKYIARIEKMYDQAERNIQREVEAVYRNYSKATGMDVQSLKTLLTKTETEKLWEDLKRQGLDKYVKGNYKARITRLERIEAEIYAKAKQVYPQEQKAHTEHYNSVVRDGYYKTIYDTQVGTGADFAFSKIDDNMVKKLLDEKWSGKNYSQRIWGNTDLLAESLSEIIGGALLSGQSIAKTSRQIRERFDVSKYYADRLVRTETNHFNNEADAMAYDEMGLDKYVFRATLDTRTSTICQDLDGEVFDTKGRQIGVNFPPMHPNCRSKTRAYMGEEIEATMKRRARNPITGKNEVVGNITYKEWAEQNGLTNSRNSGTIGAKKGQAKAFTKVKVEDIPSMDERRFNTIKAGLKKRGIDIIQDADGDAFLKHMGAEAITMSDGATIIFQSGRVPSASAVFEEIIHTTQIKKNGMVSSAGDVKEKIEYLSREIEANEKVLKYKKAYGLTDNDVESIQDNLAKYYKDIKEVTGGVSYDS